MDETVERLDEEKAAWLQAAGQDLADVRESVSVERVHKVVR